MPDRFDLRGFAAWAARTARAFPWATYDYRDPRNCALAKFAAHCCVRWDILGPTQVSHDGAPELEAAVRTKPWTYTALAARLNPEA